MIPSASRWVPTSVLAVAAVAAALPSRAAPLAASVSSQVIHACVRIVTPMDRVPGPDGRFSVGASGSGTLLHKGGLILTNCHVVARPRGGSAEQQASWQSHGYREGDFWNEQRISLILVTGDPHEPAEPAYVAYAVEADPVQDLAVLEIVGYHSDLKAYLSGSWPERTMPESLPVETVPLGDSSKVAIGEEVYVFGYPGAGGSTITYTQGHVSGFVKKRDEKGVVVEDWIKTDAVISGGNSGGTALNDRGEVIGVPTQGDPGTVALLGTSDAAKQLLRRMVKTGDRGAARRPTLPAPADTPKEGFGQVVFGTDVVEGKLLGQSDSFPALTPKIVAVVPFRGVPTGTPTFDRWLLDGREVLRSGEEAFQGPEAGAIVAPVWRADGLPGGEWVFEFLLRDQVAATGRCRIDKPKVEPPALPAPEQPGVLFTGEIVDRATRDPIEGALVLVLNTGKGMEDVLEDVAKRREPGAPGAAVLQAVQSNSHGVFVFPKPIPPGEHVVFCSADGFQDGVGKIVLAEGQPVATARITLDRRK